MKNPFKRPPPSGPLTPPLTRDECERIWGWERRMLAFYVFAMLVIIAGVSLAGAYGHLPMVRTGVILAIALLALAGAFVQFREHCPRCGSNLGRQSRLMLPQKCKQCGIPFPRRERARRWDQT